MAATAFNSIGFDADDEVVQSEIRVSGIDSLGLNRTDIDATLDLYGLFDYFDGPSTYYDIEVVLVSPSGTQAFSKSYTNITNEFDSQITEEFTVQLSPGSDLNGVWTIYTFFENRLDKEKDKKNNHASAGIINIYN